MKNVPYPFESRVAEFQVCHVYEIRVAVRHVVDIFIQSLFLTSNVVFSAIEK